MSDRVVVVREPVSTVVVRPNPTHVAVCAPGPQGPSGPAGEQGLPGVAGGGGLDDLDDVEVDEAAPGQVLVSGVDGIWRPQDRDSAAPLRRRFYSAPVESTTWDISFDPGYVLAAYEVIDAYGAVDVDINLIEPGRVVFGFGYPALGSATLVLARINA